MIDIDVHTLREHIGQEIAVGDWLPVAQDRIQQFADATGDHQWIHLDTARAEKESPYKTTIAHGFLTLSLVSTLMRDAIRIGGLRMAINYGLNRVRFISPVPSGTRIRGRFAPTAVEETGGAVQVTWTVTIERQASDKPCMVAEWLVRYYPQP
ncbi:MAG: dehydratase [Acidobacteria bacterium 13_1_40CM_3_65_5]|nr:MAG: dehydratase [Acidobacteria bacterium 13_1_40CM_3_65_5]OLE84250.1 MAG: dehydratase [Acidobacteria bacterium 13_1_20CM_2_65_9]